ncbi:NPCBM/NEW2 domain-containing protein [Saccharopolyspora erythraea]|uniref:NPCBM/NEW2 domain-containing protein n=1 Tax=Saccharopolyspora erythraea TaxID=1836 RepID=UPI0020116BF4|nr:NPCBM/NEW2 domain-containing protein [Saccharopolyspora erythraea]
MKLSAVAVLLALLTLLGSSVSWLADGLSVRDRLWGKENPPPATQTTASPATDSPAPTAPVTEPDSREVNLLDADAVEGGDYVAVGRATVAGRNHERALVYPGTSVTTYNADGMGALHALAALDDRSQSCAVTFEVRLDGEVRKRSTVRTGEVVELTADLGAGRRLELAVDTGSCAAVPVLLDPVLRP